MKTLIFNGSPRKSGDSSKLIKIYEENAKEDITIIDAYNINISPCIDCRYCWTKNACAINDYMQEIYKMIEESDKIIFVVPVYFHSVPANLKIIIDRLQVYFTKKFRGETLIREKDKEVIYILLGGSKEYKAQFDGVIDVLDNVTKELGLTKTGKILIADTDNENITTKEDIIEKIKSFARK